MMSLRAASLPFVRRCLSTNSPAMAAAAPSDPIQALFVTKIQEYATKKAAAGGSMVDAICGLNPATEAELDKVAKQYGGGAGVDMTAFPELAFAVPALDPINLATAADSLACTDRPGTTRRERADDHR